MAKKTPASIKYQVGGKDTTLGFHSVIVEAHTASTEITKFPVQTGFQISNHAIRKNRTISIEAIVTNTPMTHQGIYGSGINNAADIFRTLENLVNSATLCDVVTNLGRYKTVVFNKFNTKQQQGMTDAIRFTISGEELQIADAITKTVPTVLTFKKLDQATKEVTITAMIESGSVKTESIVTDDTIEEVAESTGDSVLKDEDGNALTLDKLKEQASAVQAKAVAAVVEVEEAVCKLGESFSIPNINFDGSSSLTTYISKGYNYVSGMYSYAVNLPEEAIKVVTDTVNSVAGSTGILPRFSGSILGGLSGVPSCLSGKAGDYVNDKLNQFTDTAIGQLRKGAHGLLTDVIELGGGNPILGATLDCIGESVSDEYGSGKATTAKGAIDDLVYGLRKNVRTVNGKIADPIRDMTITKISPKVQTVK